MRSVATGVWEGERRGLTIGLVMTVTLVAFEGLAVATIMPAVRRDLGGFGLYGWAFSAFMLASLVSTAIAGRAADAHGVGRPFTTGVAFFAVGLAIGAAAPSMLILVAGRAVQGLGAGAVGASAVTTVARGYPVELRPRMFALMSTAWVVPGLLGPGVSGVVADTLGWRWVFAGLLPLIAVSAAVAIPRLRRLGAPTRANDGAEGEHQSGARTSTALVLAVTSGMLLAGLSTHHLWMAVPLIIVGGIGGAASLSRLLPAGALLARPGLPTAVLLKGVVTFAFFGTDAFISLAVTSVRHQSVTVAGLALTAATLTWTAGAWLNAHQAATVPPRRLIAFGLTLIGVGTALMLVALSPAAPLLTIVLAWGIAGLGMGVAYQSVTLAVLAEAPEGQEGEASAAQQLADVLGIAIGTGVVGALVSFGDAAGWSVATSLRAGFTVTLAMAIIGIALTRRLAASGRIGPAADSAPRSAPSLG
jgi:MFS family permease